MMRALTALLAVLLLFTRTYGVAGEKKGEPKATLYVFLATDCPAAGRSGAALRRLAKVCDPRRTRLVLVFPNARESAGSVRKWLSDRSLAAVAVSRDPALARRWGATLSPQAAIESKGVRRYRGSLEEAGPALDAVLAGKSVPRAETRAVGCDLDSPPSPNNGEKMGRGVPYAPVAAILEKHCTSCHRPGEIGPMPFTDAAVAFGLARKIAERTVAGNMPPWKADSHGEFHDENTLTDVEKETLRRWAANPAPSAVPGTLRVRGESEERAVGGLQESRWRLGKPDAVFSMPEYAVPAEGKDVYRCFAIPAGNASEDRWVKGIEFQPGNRALVHHASVFVDLSGAGQKKDDDDPLPGYANPTPGNGPGFSSYFSVLGGWTPGHQPRRLPYGVAVFLPKGATLILEVHYHLSGKPEVDKTRFGVQWAGEPIDKRLQIGSVGSQSFKIPARSKSFQVEAEQTLSADVTVLSVTPHMHERGRRMTAYAELPSGERKKIVDIPHWDFQWQPSYRFKEPVRLPKGTKITVEGFYDNPTDREIPWGESTKDEMCVTFFAFTRDDEHLMDDPVIVR